MYYGEEKTYIYSLKVNIESNIHHRIHQSTKQDLQNISADKLNMPRKERQKIDFSLFEKNNCVQSMISGKLMGLEHIKM